MASCMPEKKGGEARMEASDDLTAFFWLPPSGDCKISNASSRSEGRGWVGIIWRAVGMELSAFRRLPSASMHDIDLLLEELFFIFGCADDIFLEDPVGLGEGGVGRRDGPSRSVHTYIASISSASLCIQVCTKIHFRLLLMSLSVIV